jgi:hypothetical protein
MYPTDTFVYDISRYGTIKIIWLPWKMRVDKTNTCRYVRLLNIFVIMLLVQFSNRIALFKLIEWLLFATAFSL